jgi:hypothetical protein
MYPKYSTPRFRVFEYTTFPYLSNNGTVVETPFTSTVATTGNTAVLVLTRHGMIVKQKLRVLLNTGVDEKLNAKEPAATVAEVAQNFLVI